LAIDIEEIAVEMTQLFQLIDRFMGWVHEVNEAMTGASHLLTALATLIATIAGRVVAGRPIIPPTPPGEPRPRLFSPKAILKGWIVTALAFAILGFLVIVAFGRSLETESVPSQLFQQRWMEFVASRPGTATLCVVTGLACALGASRAAKQAKCFRLTHAFLAVGSLYLIIAWIELNCFPDLVAQAAHFHPSWRMYEIYSTLIGCLIGGIMGAED
jgi:hypothetical protein